MSRLRVRCNVVDHCQVARFLRLHFLVQRRANFGRIFNALVLIDYLCCLIFGFLLGLLRFYGVFINLQQSARCEDALQDLDKTLYLDMLLMQVSSRMVSLRFL